MKLNELNFKTIISNKGDQKAFQEALFAKGITWANNNDVEIGFFKDLVLFEVKNGIIDNFFPDGKPYKTLKEAMELIEQVKVEPESDTLSASEAVYGFLGWLTTREESVTFSSKDNASIATDLAKEFIKANNLNKPQNDWHIHLIHPSGEVAVARAEPKQPKFLKFEIDEDCNYMDDKMKHHCYSSMTDNNFAGIKYIGFDGWFTQRMLSEEGRLYTTANEGFKAESKLAIPDKIRFFNPEYKGE